MVILTVTRKILKGNKDRVCSRAESKAEAEEWFVTKAA